ncbi:MAG: UDP-N-acetylmuramoyl-L-alanine--D-glutamate ligase [bacterium]
MKKIHFMGIRGSGISGVASLAEKMGYEVTGCDLETGGHDVGHLKNTDLLVVTPAVFYQSAKHRELVEAQKRGIAITWQEFLGKYLQKDKKVVCISGTHGKSTTTAMAGKLLEDAGLDPLVTLGANYKDWKGGSRFGKGGYFVTEADEFFDNFLNYDPEIIILNNIEFDHPDYFKSENQVFESFKKFVEKMVGKRVLICNSDSKGVQKLLGRIDKTRFKIIRYSLKDRNIDLKLKVLGKHNIANALGVVALGRYLGIKDEVIKKSLENFEGIGRRLELISEKNGTSPDLVGVKVYDDYAHHPTAIKATLSALRDHCPKNRIGAIVEPHGFARTHALFPLYKNVFKDADKVIIGPVFKARDKETFGITPSLVAKKSNHPNALGVNSFDQIVKIIGKETKKGDVILVMGAGKSHLWAREISESFKTVSFKDLTTFEIGGKIKYFKKVRNKEELLKAVSFANQNKLPIFVIGGGSDILVSDKDFDGVVIKYVGDKVVVKNNIITSEAGLEWDKLVEYSVKNNLQGMECLSGIPGTVGAAPIQNIGAYGQELADSFVELEAFDFKQEKFVTFGKKDCGFGYRESVFKRPENWQKYLITSVTFKLNKNKKPEIVYESLNKYFDDKKIKNPTLSQIRQAVLAIRKSKLEDPGRIPNAGSFFKNPIVEKYKLSAGFLIEKAGWKGKSFGNAAVSEKNALVLTNPYGKASFKEVVELSEKIIKDVYDKFGIKLEPEVQYINNTKVAILGYGLEGQDAEKYFKNLGEDITILDKKFDENYLDNLNKFDVIVRSPGVYRYLPEIVRAEKEGVKITSAIKIFFDKCPAKVIGVTGTKGKGTTSTLIYEIVKKAGKDVYLAGNIGKPYLELLPKLKKDSYVILELSSFQLIDLTISPHIAVVLNITLDHMDWHKNRTEYVNAKKNIVKHQSISDWAVLNEEYKASKSFSDITRAKVNFFSKKLLESKYKKNLLLRGEHNLENIAAAVAVAKILKIGDKTILEVLTNFPGLEHRLELVGEINEVKFYNDSFATGPQPTIAAIKSFTEPLTVILGGSEKGLDYEELGREIVKAKNIKKSIIIGEIGNKIIVALKKAKYQGSIINLKTSPMQKIVKNAYRNTSPGGVVLLSPAAASFDMFKNYKDRGNQFKEAVQNLK